MKAIQLLGTSKQIALCNGAVDESVSSGLFECTALAADLRNQVRAELGLSAINESPKFYRIVFRRDGQIISAQAALE